MEPKTENDPTDQTPYQPAIQRARERIANEEAARSQGESKTIPEPELNETNEATTTANTDISSGQSADIIYERTERTEDQLRDAIRMHRIEKRLNGLEIAMQSVGKRTDGLEGTLGELTNQVSTLMGQLVDIQELLQKRLPDAPKPSPLDNPGHESKQKKEPPMGNIHLLSSLAGGPLIMPSQLDTLVASDPYLKHIDSDLLKHIMNSSKFESFSLQLREIDQSITYVDSLHYYCVLYASDVATGAVGTPLSKLLEFEQNENQIKKDFRGIITFKTSFTKENACSETADLYIEAFNYFKQTPVHGTDSVVNPNEIYTMRWFLTTVARGMFQDDDQVLPTLIPILERLNVCHQILEETDQTPTAMQLQFLKDPIFVQRLLELPLAQVTRNWNNALDIVCRQKLWDNVSGSFPPTSMEELNVPFDERGIVKPGLLALFGLSSRSVLLMTNLIIQVYGDEITANQMLRDMLSPEGEDLKMANYASLEDLYLKCQKMVSLYQAIRQIHSTEQVDTKKLEVTVFIKIVALSDNGPPNPTATDDFNPYILRADQLTAADAKEVKKIIRNLDQLHVAQQKKQYSVTGKNPSKLQTSGKTPTRNAPSGAGLPTSRPTGARPNPSQRNDRGRGGRGSNTGRGTGRWGEKRMQPYTWKCVCSPQEHANNPHCQCNQGGLFTEVPMQDGHYIPKKPDPQRNNVIACNGCGDIGHVIDGCPVDPDKRAVIKARNDALYGSRPVQRPNQVNMSAGLSVLPPSGYGAMQPVLQQAAPQQAPVVHPVRAQPAHASHATFTSAPPTMPGMPVPSMPAFFAQSAPPSVQTTSISDSSGSLNGWSTPIVNATPTGGTNKMIMNSSGEITMPNGDVFVKKVPSL